MLQGQVPAAFEFRGDQPVFRIRGIILSLGALNGIAGSLKIALKSFENIVPLPGAFFRGQHGSFDRCGLNHATNLSADSFVYGDAPNAMQRGSPLSSQPRMQE